MCRKTTTFPAKSKRYCCDEKHALPSLLPHHNSHTIQCQVHQKLYLRLFPRFAERRITGSGHLFLSGLADLGFLGAANLLHAVLSLLALFACLFLFLVQTVTSQAVFRLEFLGKLQCVVNQCEPSWFAAAEVCAESKDENNVWCDFVHASQFFTDILLVHRWQSWMQHIANHLFTAQQSVGHELPCTNNRGWRWHFVIFLQASANHQKREETTKPLSVNK